MGDKTKTIQVWQVKKSDLTGNSDNSDDKTDLIASTGEQQSETGAKTEVSNPTDTIVEPITECTQSLPESGVSKFKPSRCKSKAYYSMYYVFACIWCIKPSGQSAYHSASQ
ncbi:hypothetical protein V6N11_070715 [Hibiscus sabdariffa]|uniref:Uncharacterized protein n=1 Tax=Hibiscus sabdariffa TaxID=183260 RepID=A0ABR2QFX2_9ROSI